MHNLVLDAESIKTLRDALGMTELQNNFDNLCAYVNQLHSLIEKYAGEPMTEATVNAASGPDGISIERNIANLPRNAIKSMLRHPSRMNLPSLSDMATSNLPNVNISEVK